MQQLSLFGDNLDLNIKRAVNANIPNDAPRPFFNWVGGKTRLYPQLAQYLPAQFGTYYEPFLGGGGMFWQLSRYGRINRAVLSDIIPDLIVSYTVVKKHDTALLNVLKHHIQNDSRDYYQLVRDAQPTTPIEIAGRFIYLGTKSYRSKVEYRYGALVPSGYMEKRKLPKNKWNGVLSICAKALQSATIEWMTYRDITPTAGDFVYLDPPYDDDKPTRFYTSNWTRDDLVALRDFVVMLTELRVMVMLSNRNTDFVRALFNTPLFKIYPIVGVSNMGGRGSKSGMIPMSEIVICNYR